MKLIKGIVFLVTVLLYLMLAPILLHAQIKWQANYMGIMPLVELVQKNAPALFELQLNLSSQKIIEMVRHLSQENENELLINVTSNELVQQLAQQLDFIKKEITVLQALQYLTYLSRYHYWTQDYLFKGDQ